MARIGDSWASGQVPGYSQDPKIGDKTGAQAPAPPWPDNVKAIRTDLDKLIAAIQAKITKGEKLSPDDIKAIEVILSKFESIGDLPDSLAARMEKCKAALSDAVLSFRALDPASGSEVYDHLLVALSKIGDPT